MRQKSRKNLHFRQWNVDQVFLMRNGGRIIAQISLTNDNELRFEKIYPPIKDLSEAIAFVGRAVANLGNVSNADGVRVRWAKDSELIRDFDLEDIFIKAFEEELEVIYDQMR